MPKGNILWVDDEIDLLKPHILLLEQRGYSVRTAMSGEDAIAIFTGEDASARFDLVFLDENMPGMGGLETLEALKAHRTETPVVMVTKSEEEDLMEQAIAKKISDYLTKPVNPTQVLLAVKKLLEGRAIVSEAVSRVYTEGFGRMAIELASASSAKDWIDVYAKIVAWEMEFDEHTGLGLKQTLLDQKREANAEFGKFVERNYRDWVNTIYVESNAASRPAMSPDVMEQWVLPELQSDEKKNVVFFVIDCMRLDQWLIMEAELRNLFKITRDYHFGILPTATPYARNAIFSGLFPSEFGKLYPNMWGPGDDDENSLNKDEANMLQKLLERKRVKLRQDFKYIKIIDRDFGAGIAQNITQHAKNHFTAIVVNFVDMLAHTRSDSPILKEIAPDESAYRSLTRSWFLHSSLYDMFKSLATVPNLKIVVSTDHGSIRCLRGAKVIGDRETSTSLRYKYGRNVKAEEKQAMIIKRPEDYKLPVRGNATNYIIAKEDYYFVYPTDYHKYLNYYRDSFQHGGISMEEVILPVVTLEGKI